MGDFSSPTLEKMLDNVAIVLKGPKYPENIGAAARIAMNMGISRLVVVRKENPDREKMLKTATHKAAALIENMEVYADLDQALASFSCVVGTTARVGGQRQTILPPRGLVDKMYPLLNRNTVAILFGPEDCGLTNDDLKYCQILTTIPTSSFSSLNLAQAIGIHCYEIYYGLMKVCSEGDKRYLPKIAGTHELEGMYDHIEQMLQRIDFFKDGNYGYWLHNVRQFLGRLQLRSKEVRVIRGFCRQFLWYDKEKKK